MDMAILIALPFAVYTVHALNLLTDATNKSFATQYDLTTYVVGTICTRVVAQFQMYVFVVVVCVVFSSVHFCHSAVHSATA